MVVNVRLSYTNNKILPSLSNSLNTLLDGRCKSKMQFTKSPKLKVLLQFLKTQIFLFRFSALKTVSRVSQDLNDNHNLKKSSSISILFCQLVFTINNKQKTVQKHCKHFLTLKTKYL